MQLLAGIGLLIVAGGFILKATAIVFLCGGLVSWLFYRNLPFAKESAPPIYVEERSEAGGWPLV